MTEDSAARAQVLADLTIGSWRFRRTAKRESAQVVRKILEHAREQDHPEAVFVLALVDPDLDDDALEARWSRALGALADLGTTYGWGSKKRRAKLVGVASQPDLLAAVQAACVGAESTNIDFLAVLAIDASEASVDALLPHVDRARVTGDALLDRLARLRKMARPDSRVAAVLDRVDAQLEAREAASPALGFAQRIGFGTPATFWFQASFGSVELRGTVPRYQGHIHVDSRREPWLSGLSRLGDGVEPMTHSNFNSSRVFGDDLGIGQCDADALPQWLSQAAATLGVTWRDSIHIRSSVRGRKREQLRAWLLWRG